MSDMNTFTPVLIRSVPLHHSLRIRSPSPVFVLESFHYRCSPYVNVALLFIAVYLASTVLRFKSNETTRMVHRPRLVSEGVKLSIMKHDKPVENKITSTAEEKIVLVTTAQHLAPYSIHFEAFRGSVLSNLFHAEGVRSTLECRVAR